MRVLVIGEEYPDSFADNLVTSLRDGGHVVRGVAPFSPMRAVPARFKSRVRHELLAQPRLARRLQDAVLDAADELEPDLCINLDYRLGYLTVRELRERTGAPVVFWYPDSPGNFGREMHVLAGYDALFLKDSSVVERYRKTLGLNAHFLPEACNPRWHRPLGDPVASIDQPTVIVAGNVYASRYVLLRELQRRGVRVLLHGPCPPRWLPREAGLPPFEVLGYLARQSKALVFRGGPAVLNSLASHEADGLNCRLFEAAACGAVVLTERRARLPELFDVPGEVRAYESVDQLVDLIRELSAASIDERRAIGDAASIRAHRDHSYLHRFASMLAKVGGG